MGFFPDLPDPETRDPEPRWVDPEWRRIPYERVPVTLPVSTLVHASANLALVLFGVDVYPTGFTFTLTASRHPEADRSPFATHELLHGGPDRGPGLRIGVLLEDGRRAIHPSWGAGGEATPRRDGPPEASISSRGGGGSHDASTAEYFVWPLPAEGDVTLLFELKAAGLDEGRVVLPGDDLRAAAAQAREIWPGARVPEPTDHGDGGLYY